MTMPTPPNPSCFNPAYGTHLIARGALRDDTLKTILQRVMKWAEDDRDKIEHHHGGSVSYVRIPPEAIVNDHGPLILRSGGEPVPLTWDKATWLEPTIFEIDGVNPNTLIEYDQVISDFKAKEEPTHDTIVLRFTYDGNFQEKTEPAGWILRWRQKAGEGECPAVWNILDLPGHARVIPFKNLTPATEYEFTLQGIARPETTSVKTPSTKPITVKTAKKPAPGEKPKPAPKPDAPKTPETGEAGEPAKKVSGRTR